MSGWLLIESASYLLISALGLLFVYFFVVTRLSLEVQRWSSKQNESDSHIYWIYKFPALIRLTDNMLVASAILLGHYNKLVSAICLQLDSDLKEKKVLQVACAFGNVSTRLAEVCAARGAKEFMLVDLMQSELDHARQKLEPYDALCDFQQGDATELGFADQSYDYVVMYFLPHELPYPQKEQALAEAERVLKPGGKIIVAEFHKPHSTILQWLGRLYFSVFEPYALEMWSRFNFERCFAQSSYSEYQFQKQTYCLGNFQVATAFKPNNNESQASLCG